MVLLVLKARVISLKKKKKKRKQVHGRSESSPDFCHKIPIYANVFVVQSQFQLYCMACHRGIVCYTVKMGKQGVKVTRPNSNSN